MKIVLSLMVLVFGLSASAAGKCEMGKVGLLADGTTELPDGSTLIENPVIVANGIEYSHYNNVSYKTTKAECDGLCILFGFSSSKSWDAETRSDVSHYFTTTSAGKIKWMRKTKDGFYITKTLSIICE